MPDPSPYPAGADRPLRESVPEPRPLRGGDAVGVPGWRQFVKGLSADFEFLLLAGALMALSGWFILESGRERPFREAVPIGLVARPDPVEGVTRAFSFMAAESRDQLLPAIAAAAVRRAEELPKPLITAAVEPQGLAAEPIFDPLGSLQISGLPAEARLSAGAALSGHQETEGHWAVAFGDLDNLVIELPRERSTPIRATLDLRTRAGVKIASLTVEVRERPESDAGSAPVAVPAAVKSKVRPAKAVRPGSKSLRKTPRSQPAATAVKPFPVFPGDPPLATKSPKAFVSAPVAPAPPATGLFKPDPKDSAGSGLSPSSREDPRFMTLRGLGMPPSEPSPVQSAPASP